MEKEIEEIKKTLHFILEHLNLQPLIEDGEQKGLQAKIIKEIK